MKPLKFVSEPQRFELLGFPRLMPRLIATFAMNKFTVERVQASHHGSPYILSNSNCQDIAQYIKKEAS